MKDQFTYDFAVDTALPQDWLNAVNKILPHNMDPRGNVGWGYPPGFKFGGMPVPLTQEGIRIIGALVNRAI